MIIIIIVGKFSAGVSEKSKRAVIFYILSNRAETAHLSFRDRELSNNVWLVQVRPRNFGSSRGPHLPSSGASSSSACRTHLHSLLALTNHGRVKSNAHLSSLLSYFLSCLYFFLSFFLSCELYEYSFSLLRPLVLSRILRLPLCDLPLRLYWTNPDLLSLYFVSLPYVYPISCGSLWS